jgi:WD40 repeat protein
LIRVAYAADGKTVGLAPWDGTAGLWDARTGRPITGPFRQRTGHKITAASLHPSGKSAALAISDFTVRVIDTQNGSDLDTPLRHFADISDVAFAPDGESIVMASHDSVTRVWEEVPALAVLCLRVARQDVPETKEAVRWLGSPDLHPELNPRQDDEICPVEIWRRVTDKLAITQHAAVDLQFLVRVTDAAHEIAHGPAAAARNRGNGYHPRNWRLPHGLLSICPWNGDGSV